MREPGDGAGGQKPRVEREDAAGGQRPRLGRRMWQKTKAECGPGEAAKDKGKRGPEDMAGGKRPRLGRRMRQETETERGLEMWPEVEAGGCDGRKKAEARAREWSGNRRRVWARGSGKGQGPRLGRRMGQETKAEYGQDMAGDKGRVLGPGDAAKDKGRRRTQRMGREDRSRG